MLEQFWLVLLFPLLGALTNGLIGRRLRPPVIGGIASLAVLASFVVTLLGFLELLGLPEDQRVHTLPLFRWIEAGSFSSEFALLLDPLSLLMMLVVTGVGFLIHVYSMEYMEGESGYYRYFCYLNLFILMMSLLVLGNNFLVMFVGWEGVGLCSFLLIGYYFEKKSAGDAAKKAFIVNRIGDVAFVLGVCLIFRSFGSVTYLDVFSQVAGWSTQGGVLTAITLLLFVGAVGKSAQIPLYVWLPDAMEGPTPVSALIHAATMVTAGVYMIARCAALFSRAPLTLGVVASIGLVTALVAALIALTQRDIKKVLAYSTVSQLGYMFLAVGVGAFGAGVFHLMTHAFFKALLFLGSGSVILAMHHQQDMFKMGGLKKYLPRTYWSMLIATAAIAGVPLLSGFFSKDEILWQAYSSPDGSLVFWLVGVLVAGLTAFYMFRLIFLTFHGEERIEFPAHDHGDGGDHGHHSTPAQPREPGLRVTGPLMLLGVFSVIAGYIGLPPWTGLANRLEHYLEPSFRYRFVGEQVDHSHAEEIGLMLVAIAVATVGIALAYHAYLRKPELPGQVATRWKGAYQALLNKLWVDELYDLLFVNPIERFSRQVLWQVVDVRIVDGAVNGTGAFFRGLGNVLRLIQSGYARSYATWVLTGASLVVFFLYWTVS